MVSGIVSTHRPRRSLLRLALRASAGLTILVLISHLAMLQPADAAVIADRIVAIVNSELIMFSEVKAETEAAEARLRAQHHGADLARRIRQTELEALTRMIETRLQLQLAKTRGVDVTDEEVKSAIKEMRRQGEKVDENDATVLRGVREQLMLLKVVDREVRSVLLVSEIELQRYYMQHQSRFLLPDEYRSSQILLVPRSNEDRAQVRARAQTAYAEIKQGAEFADMVLRYSDGPEATKGGALGFVRQGELLPPIERALAALEVGQISEPVETPQGLHILRLDEKVPPGFRPFAEVRAEIQGLVYRQKNEDGFQNMIKELKNKAFIDVKF
ncbi:MAG: peptidylprolyl isomerase [Nitrospiraceae bacterium]